MILFNLCGKNLNPICDYIWVLHAYFTLRIFLVFVLFKQLIHFWSIQSHPEVEISQPKHSVKIGCQIQF